MFSSQGQVSSIIITFLVDLEKSNISGRRVETAKNNGTTNIPSKSNSKFQPEAECNMPRQPLRGALDVKGLEHLSAQFRHLIDAKHCGKTFYFWKTAIIQATNSGK